MEEEYQKLFNAFKVAFEQRPEGAERVARVATQDRALQAQRISSAQTWSVPSVSEEPEGQSGWSRPREDKDDWK